MHQHIRRKEVALNGMREEMRCEEKGNEEKSNEEKIK